MSTNRLWIKFWSIGVKFECAVLNQLVVDDLLEIENMGARGFIKKQYSRYLESIRSIFGEFESLRMSETRDLLIEKVHQFGGFSATLGIKSVQAECQRVEIYLSECSSTDLRELDFFPMRKLVDQAVLEIQKLIAFSDHLN